MFKTCRKCSEIKPLTEYHIVKNRHINECKVCVRAYLKKRYRQKVPVSMRERLFPEPGKKLCSRCKEVKPLGEYHTKSNGSPVAACRDCMKNYQREYFQNKKRPQKGPTAWPAPGLWPEVQECGSRAKCRDCGGIWSLARFNNVGSPRRDGTKKKLPFCVYCQSKVNAKYRMIKKHQTNEQARESA